MASAGGILASAGSDVVEDCSVTSVSDSEVDVEEGVGVGDAREDAFELSVVIWITDSRFAVDSATASGVVEEVEVKLTFREAVRHCCRRLCVM